MKVLSLTKWTNGRYRVSQNKVPPDKKSVINIIDNEIIEFELVIEGVGEMYSAS